MTDTLLEKLAKDYANEADGNPIDEFTPTQKLLMMTAFKYGFKKARDMAAARMAKASEDSYSCLRSDDYLYFEQEIKLIGEEDVI